MENNITSALQECQGYAQKGYDIAMKSWNELHMALMEEEKKISAADAQQRQMKRLETNAILARQKRNLNDFKKMDRELKQDLNNLHKQQKEFSVLVFGQSVNGARRWINIAGLQFQPSEIAKFTMIVLFAKLTRRYGQDARQFRYGVLGFGGALMGILVPLALEKHLSAIMLMGMVAVVMMFVAGTSPKWLLAGAGAAAAFVLIYITFMGYAGDRVTAWLDPASDPADTGYQILQSLYAIGSGGVFGLGLGYLLLIFVMSQIKIDMVWFTARLTPLSFVWAVVLTMLSACIVDFLLYFKLEKINMAEALKSVE